MSGPSSGDANTAICNVIKKEDGCYSGPIKTILIRADVEIIPNLSKTADAQSNYRVLTQSIEIGARRTKKKENSDNKYVKLAFGILNLAPKKLYANLGKVADRDDDSLNGLIWNPTDRHHTNLAPQSYGLQGTGSALVDAANDHACLTQLYSFLTGSE
jgi:uncharacterized protein (DUF736 family)